MQLYCPVCGKELPVQPASDCKIRMTCDECGFDNVISKPSRRKTVIEVYVPDNNCFGSKNKYITPND